MAFRQASRVSSPRAICMIQNGGKQSPQQDQAAWQLCPQSGILHLMIYCKNSTSPLRYTSLSIIFRVTHYPWVYSCEAALSIRNVTDFLCDAEACWEEAGDSGGGWGGCYLWRARSACNSAQGAVRPTEAVSRVSSASGSVLHVAQLRALSNVETHIQRCYRRVWWQGTIIAANGC